MLIVLIDNRIALCLYIPEYSSTCILCLDKPAIAVTTRATTTTTVNFGSYQNDIKSDNDTETIHVHISLMEACVLFRQIIRCIQYSLRALRKPRYMGYPVRSILIDIESAGVK